MIHIELIGLPGSGKTTVINQLCHKFSDFTTDQDVINDNLVQNNSIQQTLFRSSYIQQIIIWLLWRQIYRDLYFTAFCKSNINFSKSILDVSEHSDIEQEYHLQLLKDSAARYEFCRQFMNGYILIDEGLAHYGASAVHANSGAEYLKSVPTPDYLIVLRADARTCFTRQVARTKKRSATIRNLSEEDAINRLKLYDEEISEVASILSTFGAEVVETDANKSVNEIVSTISDKVRQ